MPRIRYALNAEIFAGNPELSAESLHDVSGQPIALPQVRQLGEMLGVAPEIDQPASTEPRRFEGDEAPFEAVLLGVGNEFPQRRHLGESRRHYAASGATRISGVGIFIPRCLTLMPKLCCGSVIFERLKSVQYLSGARRRFAKGFRP